MAMPDLSRKAATIFNEYKLFGDKGIEWANEIQLAKTEEDLSLELQEFLKNPYYMMAKPIEVEKHLSGKHDQANHGRKGPIKAGFSNWNGQINKLFESIDTLEEADFMRGNATQAVFIEAAGFNGKPKVLSKAEFDALEGETVYRAVTDADMIDDYKNSEVQYAGSGTFGNGTYASERKESTEYYAGDSQGDKSVIDSRTMEMKLLPEAKVLNFESVQELREYASDISQKFETQYEASGANPAEMQDVSWRLSNEGDYTAFAIMSGVDAIRFNIEKPAKDLPALSEQGEYYTIILNRGKVAINGKP